MVNSQKNHHEEKSHKQPSLEIIAHFVLINIVIILSVIKI